MWVPVASLAQQAQQACSAEMAVSAAPLPSGRQSVCQRSAVVADAAVRYRPLQQAGAVGLVLPALALSEQLQQALPGPLLEQSHTHRGWALLDQLRSSLRITLSMAVAVAVVQQQQTRLLAVSADRRYSAAAAAALAAGTLRQAPRLLWR